MTGTEKVSRIGRGGDARLYSQTQDGPCERVNFLVFWQTARRLCRQNNRNRAPTRIGRRSEPGPQQTHRAHLIFLLTPKTTLRRQFLLLLCSFRSRSPPTAILTSHPSQQSITMAKVSKGMCDHLHHSQPTFYQAHD